MIGGMSASAIGSPAANARRRPLLTFASRHRLLTAFALLIVTVLVLRLWWGDRIARQLAAQQAEIRARGEPIDLSELTIERLPDEQNAWLLLRQAALLDNGTSPRNSATVGYPGYPPF